MIATKKLNVGDAARLLLAERAGSVTRDRLYRFQKTEAADCVDLGLYGRRNFDRWFAAEQRGRFDRAAHDRNKATKKRADNRDVGDWPAVTDPALRAQCDAELFTFATACFPELFYLEHSPDHPTLAAAIQATIEQGGKRAIACQRGFGKTVWCTLGVMWAALTGRVPMVMLIAGNDTEAANIAAGIITELETNEILYGLYPEICHCFRFMAELGAQAKPLYKDKSIRIKQRPDVVFPALPGVVGSECCVRVCGIDSRRIRGAHHKTTTGRHVRPAVVLLDDPQDDDFATRPKDIAKREKKIKKAIHGVAGPGRKVAVLMPCTVIEIDDLAARFLDHNRNPEYQGLKFPALDSFPDCFDDASAAGAVNLWETYFEHLGNDLLVGDETHETATRFYRDHRDEMARGASVRWPARIEGFCDDALQTLMNIYAAGRAAFMSEFQQDPEDSETANSYLDETQIADRFNGLARRHCPSGASTVTAGIDVQQRVLYWLVTAWCDDLKGFIVDYGTFPKQRSPQFTHLTAPYTFEDYVRKKYPLQRHKWDESLKIAIRDCVEMNIRPPIERAEGEPLLVANCHIDNQWTKSRQPIAEVAAEDENKDILQADGGMFVGQNDTPIGQRKMAKGSRRPSPDVQWYFKKIHRAPDNVLHDANFYRSQFQQGLATEPGSPGSITFYGRRPNADLAGHFSAKWVEIKEGKRQTAEIWQNKVGRDQDHWLDCAVMSRVAIEVMGLRSTGKTSKNARKGATRKKLDNTKIAAAKQRARRK